MRLIGDERGSAAQAVLVTLLVLACLVLAAGAYVLVMRPAFAEPMLSAAGLASEAPTPNRSEPVFENVGDTKPTKSQEAAEQAEWDVRHRTHYVARYDDVMLSSPVKNADLTGVLFHQASYNYALRLETELAEADYEKTAANRSMKINREQDSGEWLDSEALHLWRTADTTDMDTSIDIGAPAGTVAVAPVTGTVVLVRDYMLYDEVPDVEIHIQPDGRDDLDCVMIHTTDPVVKAGDHVEGGLTEVCQVRDIEKDLTDVQLGFFTPEGVGGNHIHIQVNDANYENYRKERLKGAVKVKA